MELDQPGKPLLVGKKVEHLFADGNWYKGRVMSVVPGFPDWYNITHYGPDVAVYSYKLQEDLAKDELHILPDVTTDSTFKRVTKNRYRRRPACSFWP